jgi:DNA processing protein
MPGNTTVIGSTSSFGAEEKIFYNAVNIAAQSNYRELAGLKRRFGSWGKAWRAFFKDVGNAPDPDTAWQELKRIGLRLVLYEDSDYPPLLKEIPWPPFGIYVLEGFAKTDNSPRPKGCWDKPTLAIVGTRKATENGKVTARHFAEELGRASFEIVSGLAFGIDAAAHEGALNAEGRTIAVLGNGLDRFYPRSNEKLARKIIEHGGIIISEYPPGAVSLPHHFLERNRIISGLSKGVLVIEAPKESGALVTARFAIEQNREVFVVPGPHNHPNFQGSHQLIRKGAELITEPKEILESFGFDYAAAQKDASTLGATKEEQLILKTLQGAGRPLDIDKIIELTKLETHIVSQALSFLLVKNVLKEDEEGYTIN